MVVLHVSCCQRWMGLARVNRLPRAQIPCVGPTNEGQHRSQVSGRSFSVELLNRLMSHWLWICICTTKRDATANVTGNKQLNQKMNLLMRNKILHVIFICGVWELIEGIFIFLPQVIVFLNQDKFNQLPTDSHSPKHSFLIRKGKKKI